MASSCEELERELAALKAEVAKLKPVDENSIIQKIKDILLPIIGSKIFDAVNPLNGKIGAVDNRVSNLSGSFESTLRQMNEAIGRVDSKATNAVGTAKNAVSKAESIEEVAKNAAREASLANGLASQAKKTADIADTAASAAKNVANTAKNTAETADVAVNGFKRTLNEIGGRIDGLGRLINKVETRVGDAIAKAAEAIGISKQALSATAKLGLKILEIFNIIATFFVLFEQIANLEVLGARIDAVERSLSALGNDVSGILGRLLGLRNRIEAVAGTVPPVKDLADRALVEALNANHQIPGIREAANNALGIATTAFTKANNAEGTANRAVSLATTANTTANNASNAAKSAEAEALRASAKADLAKLRADEANGLGRRALDIGGKALQVGGTALTTALTALSLYQGLKSLRGLRGERGLQGIPGLRGRDGTPGKDGITTVVYVQVPGQKGEKGDKGDRGDVGIGRPGKDGKDVDSSQLALINNQLAEIRATQAVHTSLIGNIKNSVGNTIGSVQSAILARIDSKLGQQITGGIGGTLQNLSNAFDKFDQWSKKTQLYSLITMFITLHNAWMLSNNLGQTLIATVNAGLQAIGLKDSKDQPYDIGAIISGTFENFVKSVIGAEVYQELSQDLAKANRIYQATSNLMNQIWSLSQTVTNALEMIASWNNKIGNALKKWGVVGGTAYSWMPESPNFHDSKLFGFLTKAQEGANIVQSVVQIPIDVAQQVQALNQASLDTVNSALEVTTTNEQGQTVAPLTGIPTGEADIVKATQEAIKANSVTTPVEKSDYYSASE